MTDDNKLVKTLTDAATITGLADGFVWIANKVIKEPMTSDPSSNLMNYVKFTEGLNGVVAFTVISSNFGSSTAIG